MGARWKNKKKNERTNKSEVYFKNKANVLLLLLLSQTPHQKKKNSQRNVEANFYTDFLKACRAWRCMLIHDKNEKQP